MTYAFYTLVVCKAASACASRTFIPSVIEPSFGIGSIMYCLFEHAYYHREGDEKRTVFRFQPVVAPFKATVLPLLQKDNMNALAQQVSSQLTKAGLYNVIDTTGGHLTYSYSPASCCRLLRNGQLAWHAGGLNSGHSQQIA